MADREDEDEDFMMMLESKRKPWENSAAAEGSTPKESSEMRRRDQRNLMATAVTAILMNNEAPSDKLDKSVAFEQEQVGSSFIMQMQAVSDGGESPALEFGYQLSSDEANQLFSIVFGANVTKGILAQLTNQGTRFSPDREMSMGLVCMKDGHVAYWLLLVDAPFGHASHEIVNSLLCGVAVDLGGGMSLKGISNNVEVGFLTLMESLNFCKVGQFLKCPTWVMGIESHYTVLFSLIHQFKMNTSSNHKSKEPLRCKRSKRGRRFHRVEGFHQVLKETNINLPPHKMDGLCNSGFILWNEF